MCLFVCFDIFDPFWKIICTDDTDEVSDIVFNAVVLCYQNSDALKDALKWFPDRPNYTGNFFKLTPP